MMVTTIPKPAIRKPQVSEMTAGNGIPNCGFVVASSKLQVLNFRRN
jgi:hypothetical protein